MGNHIYTGPASQVSFICFVENVKYIQSCQTCHSQGWDKILISLQIRGKILRCTRFHCLDLRTRFSPYVREHRCLTGIHFAGREVPPRVLEMKDFPSWEWPAFLTAPLLAGSKQTFALFPILCLPPTCTATNPLACTFHIFRTDGSFGMNYTRFHSQPNPRHSVITTDKRAHSSASYARTGLLCLCTDKVLNGQLWLKYSPNKADFLESSTSSLYFKGKTTLWLRNALYSAVFGPQWLQSCM